MTLSPFAEHLAAIRHRIELACSRAARDPAEVGLLAVSKTIPAEAVLDALAAGQCEFGENRVQEIERRSRDPRLGSARWHMIGSLQTNKVDGLLDCPGLALLHSIDRPRLIEKLDASCASRALNLDVLIQVNATGERQKHGVTPDGAVALGRLLASSRWLRARGVMGMGPIEGPAAGVFASIARVRADLCEALGVALPILSLGMSHDLEEAVAAGSTLLRIGSALFGTRG